MSPPVIFLDYCRLIVCIHNVIMQYIESSFLHLIEKYKAIVYKIANLYAQNTGKTYFKR